MSSTTVYDWLAIAVVLLILLLMFWGINDIISRCIEYWRAYREPDKTAEEEYEAMTDAEKADHYWKGRGL